MPNINVAVENAIGLEVHRNRYFYDYDTTEFIELLGGYAEGNYFVPVRFGVKASQNATNTLYIIVDQEKIKMDRVSEADSRVARGEPTSLLSNISIPHLFANVNSKDIMKSKNRDLQRKAV